MPIMNKVVVTGLGVVSPIGCDIDSFWTACLNNQSNVQAIPKQWNNYHDYNSGIWSPLPDMDFKSLGFSRLEIMQRDPVSLIAMMATKQALEDARINVLPADDKNRQFLLEGVDSEKAGVFVGTGIGGVKTFLENHACHMLKSTTSELAKKNQLNPDQLSQFMYPQRFNPFVVSMLIPNAVPASIGIKYSLHGMNRAIGQACSSGTTAIGSAYEAVKSGQIDFAICGGAEYLYDEYGSIYRGFDVAKTLANPGDNPEKANRPFDKARTGFLYSQGGAGILILESESHAKKRGANILAQISGFAETFDAYSMMSIKSGGRNIKRMIHQSLKEAQLELSDIDYINAHGTGTQTNDEIESDVIQELFGLKPIVNSSKSIIGHSIGASGALEAIVSILSLQNQTTHSCNNLNNPIRDLNFVTIPKEEVIRHVLSESFAFGGHNSALIMSLFDK